jgi:DNA-directed RNA polymerase specialized sigma24 family protein
MGGKSPAGVASFEQLLTALDPDRERAGRYYRDLHRQLLTYFEWRCSGRPDEQADEVLDRVVRRIAEGEHIDNLQTYALGVARLLLREERKRAMREGAAHAELRALQEAAELPSAHDAHEEAQTRFECCLEALPQLDRAIILAYYTGDGRDKIETRRRLALEAGMDLNALRVRAHRIRARLERCMQKFSVSVP